MFALYRLPGVFQPYVEVLDATLNCPRLGQWLCGDPGLEQNSSWTSWEKWKPGSSLLCVASEFGQIWHISLKGIHIIIHYTRDFWELSFSVTICLCTQQLLHRKNAEKWLCMNIHVVTAGSSFQNSWAGLENDMAALTIQDVLCRYCCIF